MPLNTQTSVDYGDLVTEIETIIENENIQGEGTDDVLMLLEEYNLYHSTSNSQMDKPRTENGTILNNYGSIPAEHQWLEDILNTIMNNLNVDSLTVLCDD